jgi:hypothetical protein
MELVILRYVMLLPWPAALHFHLHTELSYRECVAHLGLVAMKEI